MPVTGRLFIYGPAQAQIFNNCPRSEIKGLLYKFNKLTFRNFTGAKGISVYRNWVGYSYGIGQLNFTFICQSSSNDILGLDKDIVKSKVDKLKQEKLMIESRLYELRLKNYDWLDESKIRAYILKSKKDLLSNDQILKRKVVETFVDKIKVYPDRIDLNFKVYMVTSPLLERGIVGYSTIK